MQFLTHVLGEKIFDSIGEPIGKISDVIVRPTNQLPVVSAIVVQDRAEQFIIPWPQIREEVRRFSLPVRKNSIARFRFQEGDIWLRRDVLDRQIVDIHDYKLVRINDVRFVEGPGQVWLLGVDASMRGLLRELGIEWLASGLMHVFPRLLAEKLIAWDDVQTLNPESGSIKLKIPLDKLSRLHPADVADIIEQMNPAQRADIIENLDIQTAADVLPEASPEIQARIIEDLDPERACDILEEMDPDEAADILGDLSDETTEQLLRDMSPDEAEDVRELLTYKDETAGGLMTTDYVAIADDMTAQETINHLRELEPDAETVYYLYVVTSDHLLVGVVSLRDLIVAKPDTKVSEFMISRVIHVHPDASVRETAELFQKYNLLALPVAEHDHELKGIITIDDMLEHIPANAWKGRIRHPSRAPEHMLETTP